VIARDTQATSGGSNSTIMCHDIVMTLAGRCAVAAGPLDRLDGW
jgi:hypothetical protein